MDNIVLLGHGVGIKFAIESLKKKPILNLSVKAVVTHPYKNHLHDLKMINSRKELYGDYAFNVFDLKNHEEIDFLEAEDVNNKKVIKWIKKYKPKYIISVGCRNILKREFLETFKDKVLNIHTTPLPRYRGAASDSWMILNGEWGSKQYGCLHYIDEGIDTGDIIAKEPYEIPVNCYPIEIFKLRMNVFKSLIPSGIRNLNSKNFEPEKQNTSQATTFPRLFTPEDGKIDFKNFSGDEILKFIYAFGYPHEGAHCYSDNKKMNILEAELFDDMKFHSFANGLIFGKNSKGEPKVIVNDGYILIKKVEIDGSPIDVNLDIKVGKYLK